MYCPYCGAKNPPGTDKCFVCEKRIPNLDDSRPRSSSSRQSSNGSGEPLAALGDRLIAVLLDTAFLGALFSIGFSWVSSSGQSWFLNRGWMTGTVATAVLLISFLYYWLLEGAFGATLGKAIAGVQVRPTHGSGLPGFRAALWRNLFRFIDGIAFYFVGYLVALFSRQNRRIGDYAAGTIVVQRRVAWGERLTVVLLWLVGVAGFSWAAYTLCPTCVDLQVTKVVERLGFSPTTSSVPHIASN